MLPFSVAILAFPHAVEDAHLLKPSLVLGVDAMSVVKYVLKLEGRRPSLIIRRYSLDAIVVMPSTPRGLSHLRGVHDV